MTNNTPRVLLVGHCGPDTAALERFIDDQITDPQIDSIAKADAAEEHLAQNGADLVLVNRVIPHTDERGQDWIGRMRAQYPDTAFMLISNQDDAQGEAQNNSALPGFGKADLHTEEAAERLQHALT